MTTLEEISTRWSVKRLADVFQTQLGKMLSEKARTGLNPKPYLRNANIQWERANLSNVYVMDFTEGEQRKFALKSGDLLMCEGGEIGRTCLWSGELSECFFQKAIHRLRPRSTDAFPEFYLFWLEWAFRYANLYGVTGTQTTIAHLPQEKLEELRVPVPKLSEQRAVAHVLRTVQKAKEARQRELALERERKAALMEHLFTHGTRGAKTKQTEIGEIPDGWAIETLGNIAQAMQYGLSVRGEADGAVPILRMSNLIGGRVDATDLQRVTIGTDLLRSFTVLKGDLLFNRTNSQDLVGKTAIFALEGTYVFASYLIRIRIDESKADPMFVNAYLNSENVLRRVRGLATRGVSQSNISASKLARFRVPLPPQDEQQAIASVFAGCDSKTTALQRETTIAEELFGATLEGLMTGRLSTERLIEEHQPQ